MGVTTSMPLKDSVALSRLAEESSYYRVWVGEDIPLRDVFSYLSVLALKTSKIRLATGITSVMVRNFAVLANSAAGIQWLSDGRFALGLGVGGIPDVTQLMGHRPERVVERMGEVTDVLKRVFSGERITYEGEFVSLRGYRPVYRVSTPKIYYGVRGAKLLALAGEMADGVIFSGPIERLVEGMKIVDEAADKAGRDPEEVDRVLWNAFVLTKDKGDIELARRVTAVMMKSMKDYQVKAVKELCIFGNEREIQRKMRKYAHMGFHELVVGPPYGRDPREAVATLGEK